jgi:hypothetical protein
LGGHYLCLDARNQGEGKASVKGKKRDRKRGSVKEEELK